VNDQLALFFPEFESLGKRIKDSFISTIHEVLQMKYRKYLSIFKLERDTSLTDMIFNAVHKGTTICLI
jgi:hypothetical protein